MVHPEMLSTVFLEHQVIPDLKETRAVTESLVHQVDMVVTERREMLDFVSLVAPVSKVTKVIVDWTDSTVQSVNEVPPVNAAIPDKLVMTVYSAHLVYPVLRFAI